jgi:hypothetical protein
MMIGQHAAREHAQPRAAQHARKDDERNHQCTQNRPFQLADYRSDADNGANRGVSSRALESA